MSRSTIVSTNGWRAAKRKLIPSEIVDWHSGSLSNSVFGFFWILDLIRLKRQAQ